jgi:hypothetical protein
MALSRDTIKILLFALLCVALIVTVYFVNKKSVKEKFQGGVPRLGRGEAPFGCRTKINKALKSGKLDTIVPESGLCKKNDDCCNFYVDIYEPDTLIQGFQQAAAQAKKPLHDMLAILLATGRPPRKDPITGEDMAIEPKEMYNYYKMINRMQALNIPTNIFEYNALQSAAKAAEPKSTGPNLNFDQSGISDSTYDIFA